MRVWTTRVMVDADTEIEAGLVVGNEVEVDAILRADGSLLATEIETEERDRRISRKTTLQGIFEGVDDQGRWIISGTPVAVGPGSDTDGIPHRGQRVKVKGLLQEDGSLLAREIENKRGSQGPKGKLRKVRLGGIFQGLDDKGNWVVNGARFSVDPRTRLKGTPGVGRRVKVKAVLLEDGSLIAAEVEGDDGADREPESKAELRGVIEEILDDGTLIINGIPVALSVLTEIEGEPQTGDFVEVEALFQEKGPLIAREVKSKGKVAVDEFPGPSKVEIEGVIDRLNEDGTLVVNGMTVAVSALSKIKGKLEVDPISWTE